MKLYVKSLPKDKTLRSQAKKGNLPGSDIQKLLSKPLLFINN